MSHEKYWGRRKDQVPTFATRIFQRITDKIRRFLIAIRVASKDMKAEDIFYRAQTGKLGGEGLDAATLEKRQASTEGMNKIVRGRNPVDTSLSINQQVDQVLQLARDSKPLRIALDNVSEQMGGVLSVEARIKEPDKTLLKFQRSNQRAKNLDPATLGDALGMRLGFNTLEELRQLIPLLKEQLREQGIVVLNEEWDRMMPGVDGDFNAAYLDVQYPNGVLGEIQISPKQEIEVNKNEGHTLYEKWRNDIPKEGDPRRSEYLKDRSRMQKIYQDGLFEFMLASDLSTDQAGLDQLRNSLRTFSVRSGLNSESEPQSPRGSNISPGVKSDLTQEPSGFLMKLPQGASTNTLPSLLNDTTNSGEAISTSVVNTESEKQGAEKSQGKYYMPRHKILGSRAALALDKANGGTYLMDQRAQAIWMSQQKSGRKPKYTALEIKLATGWEMGTDNLWRYEAPDANVDWDKAIGSGKREFRLDEILPDEQLFTAYPDLRETKVRLVDTVEYKSAGYNEAGNYIEIGTDTAADSSQTIDLLRTMKSMGDTQRNEVYDTLSGIVVHEVQHAIQASEGFARGGNLGWGDQGKYNDYFRLAGETESRNVTRRRNMTEAERRATLLETTEDVKRKKQVVSGVKEQTEAARYKILPTTAETAEAERQYKEVEAKYKGTDTWLKAPNGKASNLNERQWVQVRTPAFKAWFGDWENDPANASKVADENGEPRVWWHASLREFNEFKRKGYRKYAFFAESSDKAMEASGINQYYRTHPHMIEETFPNVLPVFINAKLIAGNPKTGVNWYALDSEPRYDPYILGKRGFDAVWVDDEGGVSLAVPLDNRARPVGMPIMGETYESIANKPFVGEQTAAQLGVQWTGRLTGGLPGAGKSFGLKYAGISTEHCVGIDSDENKRYIVGTAGEAHDTSSQIAEVQLQRAIKDGYNFTYDSLLSNLEKADWIIKSLVEKGGKAEIFFTHADIFTSRVRTTARYESFESNREIPNEPIIKGANRSLPTLIKLWEKYQNNDNVDFYFMDNNDLGGHTRPVFTKINGELKVFDKTGFALLDSPVKLLEGGKYATHRSRTYSESDLQSRTGEIAQAVGLQIARIQARTNTRHLGIRSELQRQTEGTGSDRQGQGQQGLIPSWDYGQETTQIKSATANVGTYSSENADIRYKPAPKTPEELNKWQREQLRYMEAIWEKFYPGTKLPGGLRPTAMLCRPSGAGWENLSSLRGAHAPPLWSAAPPGLVGKICPPYGGLTPHRYDLSPLRGWVGKFVLLTGGSRPTAMVCRPSGALTAFSFAHVADSCNSCNSWTARVFAEARRGKRDFRLPF
ncbi:MAG TPA: zeta toxin family protein [Candidatus Syntrophosphaera sp.]|nr:zeta toxin family protein [Candidatus Syntrophosphaera sp.]